MTFWFQNESGDFSFNSKSDESKVKTDNSSNKNNQELEAARRKYEYNYTYIPSIPMVDKLPRKEYPSSAWVVLVTEKLATTLLNNCSVIYECEDFSKKVLVNILTFIARVIAKCVVYPLIVIVAFLESNSFLNLIFKLPFLNLIFKPKFGLLTINLLFLHYILHQISSLLPSWIVKSESTEDVRSLQEYKNLFKEIKLPDIADDFQEDETFAYMQVAGYNPVMIEQVKQLEKLEEKFPVTEAQYQQVMGTDDSLKAAAYEGRLYLADYQSLEGAANSTFPKQQKYVYAPLALFAVPKGTDSSRLMQSVAIQCTQNPQDELLFTPKSGKYAWLFAKTIVQMANSNYHETLSHLGRTHLFVGRFAIATHRQLSDKHPLSLLLRPHFEGTLLINDGAQKSLIAPGGGIDKLFSSTIDSSRALVEADLQKYSFNKAMLPKQLEERGVDDTDKLPVYPYRDDALLIWYAIRQWVSDYLDIDYKNDEDVQNDTELQNWAAEVVAYEGARVYDFGEKDKNGDTKILTFNYLVDATTLIIFTASAQHAAVNFPQKDMMTYAPAVPLAAYKPVSILKGEVTKQDYLNLLPPLKIAESQLNLTYLLGSVHYTRLGYYRRDHFKCDSVEKALEKFQQNLQNIKTKIDQRNEKESNEIRLNNEKEFNENSFTYEYLLPSNIPQSINI